MKQNWQWTVVFATGFRMFLQAILLEREAYSACWLTSLVGCVIALPFILVVARKWTQQSSVALPGSHAGQWLRLFALGYLLVDTAQMVLLYQEGTKFASLSSYPTTALYLVLLLFALFVVRQNLNGVFGLCAALKSALVACMAMLIVFRLGDMSPVRLLPALGGGAKQLMLSGLSLAGHGFSFVILLSSAPDIEPRTGTIAGMWITACAGSTLFTALETMISPITPGEPTGAYLAVGRLLTSGRSQTSLQLVLYMAWFMLLFIVVCVNLKCMAVSLSGLARKPEKLVVQLTVVIGVTLLAMACEHMIGDDLNAFLDKPGAFRALLLPATLLILLPQKDRKAVSP